VQDDAARSAGVAGSQQQQTSERQSRTEKTGKQHGNLPRRHSMRRDEERFVANSFSIEAAVTRWQWQSVHDA
jgi:hypothetical protein